MEQRKILTLLYGTQIAIGFALESRVEKKALEMLRKVFHDADHIAFDRLEWKVLWFDVWHGDVTEETHSIVGVSVEDFDENRIYLSE